MNSAQKISKNISKNKRSIFGVLVWGIFSAIGGLATSFIPVVPSDNKLIDLIIAATVTLNVIVVYIAFTGAARIVFKPNDGLLGSLKFIFRKDMLTTLVGVLVLGIVFISIPSLATHGVWHIPSGAVAAVSFLYSWMVISISMKRIYSIQFFEEVLSLKEKAEYEANLNAKPEKIRKSGMFLFDLNNTIRARLNKITNIEKKRTHKIIFPFLQSLFVLLSPALILFWSLWIFDLQSYTTFTAITAPFVMALAAGLWAFWHVKGGFTKIVARRRGRVMSST